MDIRSVDTVIVGAGHAGLAVSFFLQKNNIPHIIFEKGQIGESWLSQRWNSFRLNTPNKLSTLPGLPYAGPEPDGFSSAAQLVDYFNQYATKFDLPVQTGVCVYSVTQMADKSFKTMARDTQGNEVSVSSKALVVASGILNKPKIPTKHDQLPNDINQIHSINYSSPAELPQGAVLVIGSGQTGCQICEDLLKAGRDVYLCTSKVGRVPRRYRGKDIFEWALAAGYFDVTPDQLEDPAMMAAPQPQVSGVGRYGHTVSLQSLAGDGVKILGRYEGCDGNTLFVGNNAKENVVFGDIVSEKIKGIVESYLTASGTEAAPLESDPADQTDPECLCAENIEQLDLKKAGITSVIWSSGFSGDFSWLDIPESLKDGAPSHTNGISGIPGLYYAGFPWLRKRKSGIIAGIDEDARYISDAIIHHLNGMNT